MEAGGKMAGRLFFEARHFAPAKSADMSATRRERAARERRVRRWHGARDLDEARRGGAAERGAEPRHRGQEPLRIRMQRPAKQTLDPRLLDLAPAYMTTTRSAISATTPRLCVISTIAVSILAFRARIRSRIWAWIVTSSAVVGSSAISNFGLQASAIAIITR